MSDLENVVQDIARLGSPRTSRLDGAPGCPTCHGTGRFKHGRIWRRCTCTRPTAVQAELVRRYNQQDGRPFRLPGADRVAG